MDFDNTNYDFEGWASKNDLKCADGVTIRRGAFKINDGKKVPLVWNHQHKSVGSILGHAILQNRDEGVYAYCKFNDSEAGKAGKEAVVHGDVDSMSIWADTLKKDGSDILHGVIREVSLVLAGANPGAKIESAVVHGLCLEDDEEEGILYTGESILVISHSNPEEGEELRKKEEKEMPEEPKKEEINENETIKDIFDTFTEKQKTVVYALVGQAINDAKEEDKKKGKENDEVKHNMFDEESYISVPTITREEEKKILADAKRLGSLREGLKHHLEEGGILAHALDTTGMEVATGTQTYGINDIDMLFPEYKTEDIPPEFISRNMDWVGKVMSKVTKTPFKRIKSQYANITEDEARAKGYIKGKQKKEEVFSLLKRTTDPQTIYKLQKLDRDDILDITDFDVVRWIRGEMQVMLDEEKARAILIGDGRSSDSEYKIKEDHIRPVVKDVPLFNTLVKVSVPATATEGEIADATIDAIIRARKKWKGTGKPDFFTTEDVQTEMLLIKDQIGHRLYKSEAELATTLRVGEIVTVEPMESQTITVGSGASAKTYPLIGTIVNLADYKVGGDTEKDRGAFDDFDINYNQYTYLIETRMSGALTKPYSALTIVLDKAAPASGGGNQGGTTGGEDDNT